MSAEPSPPVHFYFVAQTYSSRKRWSYREQYRVWGFRHKNWKRVILLPKNYTRYDWQDTTVLVYSSRKWCDCMIELQVSMIGPQTHEQFEARYASRIQHIDPVMKDYFETIHKFMQDPALRSMKRSDKTIVEMIASTIDTSYQKVDIDHVFYN
jgi:hypothetical protein